MREIFVFVNHHISLAVVDGKEKVTRIIVYFTVIIVSECESVSDGQALMCSRTVLAVSVFDRTQTDTASLQYSYCNWYVPVPVYSYEYVPGKTKHGCRNTCPPPPPFRSSSYCREFGKSKELPRIAAGCRQPHVDVVNKCGTFRSLLANKQPWRKRIVSPRRQPKAMTRIRNS
jgi:hypothetical protein